ncbi:MAG: DUF5655 domain-containing protein [Chloroflexota bacterium]
MTTQLKELWQCPNCGERFVTPNMWHSYGRYSLGALFARSEPHVREIYDRLVELTQALGPVTIIPQKSRIAFQVRVRFFGCMPRKSHLLCGFWFTYRHDHPRFHKIEKYSPRAYGHFIRVQATEEFDEEFMGWLREAYAIGQQKHLGQSADSPFHAVGGADLELDVL